MAALVELTSKPAPMLLRAVKRGLSVDRRHSGTPTQLLAAFAGRSAFICLRTQLGRAPDKLAVASARRYQAAQGERAAPLTRDCTGQNRAVVGQRPGKADRDKARRPKQPLASIKMELVGSGVEEASHLEASLGYSRILRVCIELEQRGHLATRGLLNLQGQLR
jgi:hypothetical protein